MIGGRPATVVGLMSGTSADGIDAAVVEVRESGDRLRVRLLAFVTRPYPEPVREALFRCFEGRAGVREVGRLHARLGELFAEAAEAAIAAAGRVPERVDLIASHGQTVWHQPPEGGEMGATLQLGEAARIAERLRRPVVSDFRQQDMAAGGQGAPLVPYVDYLLLARPDEHRAVQNLGGIANVTYLPAGCGPDRVIAFDTGPGNAWIDAAAALCTGGAERCDRDGRLAASAAPDAELLEALLTDPFFEQPPPKSTGRERFGAERVRALWEAGWGAPERQARLVSTLTQLTADSIARAYRNWLGPVDTVLLCGGGVRNPELTRRLREALAPARVRPLSLEEDGLDPDSKEAVAFAVLGYETFRRRPSNLPHATGARRRVVQGKITWP